MKPNVPCVVRIPKGMLTNVLFYFLIPAHSKYQLPCVTFYGSLDTQVLGLLIWSLFLHLFQTMEFYDVLL